MLGKRQERTPSSRPISLYVNRDKYLDRLTAQLEYYWSDANVKRDKFFAERLQRDAECWVTVAELLTFPIVRALKASAAEILLAARQSEFFVVQEECIDRDWRKFPPRESIDIFANQQQDADRTVYIEPLPLTVNREELATVVDRVGTVEHISIPRHPVSGERLGHAFVEFLTASEARECVRRLHRTWPDIWRRRRDGRRLSVLSYKRWLALRDEVKTLSKQGALKYCAEVQQLIAANPQFFPTQPEDVHEDEEELDDAEDSLEDEAASDTVRRKQPSTIRPNSIVKISGLPEVCRELDLKVWLGHFAAPVQHLDFRPALREAYVRLASRAARDFFLRDFANHSLSLDGLHPEARALSVAEFEQYFAAFQRERLRRLRSLAPQDLAGRRTSKTLPTGKQTLLAIKRGWGLRRHSSLHSVGWTDSVAGNEKWAAPGTSDSFRRPFDRMTRNHVAQDSPSASSPRKRRRLDLDQ